MTQAVHHYAADRRGPMEWMLGRFVVPAARLDELSEAVLAEGGVAVSQPWRISALVGQDAEADLETIAASRVRPGANLDVDAIEVWAGGADEIARLAGAVPPGVETYFELEPHRDLRQALGAVAKAGARAKIRTGGVTAGAFPTTGTVLDFIGACADEGVPFKATAGLHHPICGSYPLTYESGAPLGKMWGFLNLLLATALILRHSPRAEAAAALEDSNARSFRFASDHLNWRNLRLDEDELMRVRQNGLVSFGSCSFAEPVSGLTEILSAESDSHPAAGESH